MRVIRINTTAFNEEDFYLLTTLNDDQIAEVIQPIVNAELYIDEHRPAVVFDVTVRPEDYVNGTNNHPTKSPLALALQRSLDGTSYRVERAGLKALVISRGIYQFAFFMPRRVWRKVSCLEFGDNPPSSPIKFAAEFEMIF